MKMFSPSLLVLAIAGGIAPAAIAGQRVMVMEGQKARPDPIPRQDLTPSRDPIPNVDVPVIPAQDTPIVLAQAAAPAADTNPHPDYILTTCAETESTGDPRSAMRAVDPAGLFAVYLQNHNKRTVDMAMLAAIKTTMLEGTQHGKIFTEVDNLGLTSYHYDPTPNYLGNDRAVFLAEFEGKVYKIVVELHVFRTVNENNPTCPDPQLIKVTKPSSGASGYGAGYDLSPVSVTFADLAGAAVGQSNTGGITLDNNAAGYNWFIDTTPGLNEEFLPTSNPNEWVAKAGSAAYGKMDMLSVLLHEYGHALREKRGQIYFSQKNSGTVQVNNGSRGDSCQGWGELCCRDICTILFNAATIGRRSSLRMRIASAISIISGS